MLTANLMCKVKSIGKSKWKQKPVTVLENGGVIADIFILI